ncbi:MAG: amylo-alpha-1,6-glucosidase [Firmicutes bacterium]|nr:amylo-alpha-1,6-glucosidase [Bacillota bacterium]
MTSRWRHEPIGGPRRLEVGNGGLIVLKDGPLFLVQPADGRGPVHEAGLYYRDTRFLNGVGWWIEHEPLVVLSTAAYDANRAQVDLTNPDMVIGGQHVAAHSLHFRMTFIVADALYVRIRQLNFAQVPLDVHLILRLASDYHDIFEVRGVVERTARGHHEAPDARDNQLTFTYHGLDDHTRQTQVTFDRAPDHWVPGDNGAVDAVFFETLPPRVKRYRYFTVRPMLLGQAAAPSGAEDRQPPSLESFARHFTLVALKQARAARDWSDQCTVIESDSRLYNNMIQQATHDMRALMTDYPEGRIIDAGIPWYVAPFGRDAAIAGIETLMLNPAIAADSIRFLARLQGQAVNDWRDEEPGKIPHEYRQGELAQAGEIPHTPYYGSIDSTLWWIIALYETWRFTGDMAFLRSLEEPLAKAVEWMRSYGDRDHDLFLEYQRRAPLGLVNQGWKDSFDSVMDEAGRLAKPPIALVEVQGYAYYAWRAAAELFRRLGRTDDALRCHNAARALKAAFLKTFVKNHGPEIIYALDGAKQPIRAVTSNEGHLLFTGILPAPTVRAIIRRLLHPDMLSGYGVRTLSQTMPYYNPMSYHNGSVWPHDNAIIAWGLKRQGAVHELMTISHQLWEASQYFPSGRLPELYCGFTRRAGAGPVEYPVACNPQAWAAAVPFFLLQLWLGISVRGHEVHIQEPSLPPWINELYLDRLRIAGGELTLEFARGRGVTFANVIRREGPIEVIIEPVKRNGHVPAR